ncbi:shikimate kinase [Prochlorococcus sp. MIT 1223]|uniref:shikimate kinase n=1 Tax=Prochlorococcus sp. MIT 1223 TaxID=3096217 RepID=UPI002A74FFCA|nr:shikimate kinase [Prochlorococcus sp. MIT 1223]
MSSTSLKQILGGRNLYLIGMMGSGKSETGPHIAQKLGYRFVDTDLVIEKAVKKSITQIFEEDGECAFREIETQVLKEIGKLYSLVIATGGGIVTRSENWGILHQGIVVWLDPGPKRLLERLKKKNELEKRPLIANDDTSRAFEKLNQDRIPQYNEADLHISVQEESPKELSNLIAKNLISILNYSENQDGQRTIE